MTKTIELRYELLTVASRLLAGGPIEEFGHVYEGEEAIQKGFDVVALIQILDRRYGNKASRN